MNKKSWIVWAILLLLPGAVGLSIHFAQKSSLHNRISLSAERSAQDPTAKEYLRMYEQWDNLPAQEKANNPWGYGSYGGPDIQKRLQAGQSDRLTADLPSLERGGSVYPEELTDVMYGPGWQQSIEEYKKQLSVSEMILIGSTFLLAVGGLILFGGIAKTVVSLLIKRRLRRKEEALSQDGSDAQAQNEDMPDACSADTSQAVDDPKSLETDSEPAVLTELSLETQDDPPAKDADASKEKNAGYFQSHRKAAQSESQPTDSAGGQIPTKSAPASKSRKPGKSQKDSYFGWAVDLNDTSDLETLMTTEPLTKELTELTEEVSAIRQFAAQQQDQMRKLQDGYDWMIIRRFCLRIIRSIDHIDDRITLLREQEDDASNYLEDIRDELIFALESSGVEQFKPDLNITFKGLEKYAEAVRDRVLTESEQLCGCIAEVARPGYQYLVNDDDVKIVRCAQVKLFETKPTE